MIPGKNIRLRPIDRDDLPRFVLWFADPEVRAHLAQYRPLSLEQETRWFEQNLASEDTQAWAIDALPGGTESKSWEHIGGCGYHAIDWRNRSGEIGILIGVKAYWNLGYGTDAVRTLVAWGFSTLNLNRVFLRVYADNPRGIRCYEKVGFQLEGRLRQDNFHDGAYRDTLVMAVLRENW
jgi:RimJ/RimL family protein N-acetyltransferase